MKSSGTCCFYILSCLLLFNVRAVSNTTRCFLHTCRINTDTITQNHSASEKHITALSMEPGDVLLVDNYRALHGRDVFDGDRFHAVSWFTWDDNEQWRGDERRIIEKNGLNVVINKMMDWLPKDFESDQS
jgi:hypothetical protein